MGQTSVIRTGYVGLPVEESSSVAGNSGSSSLIDGRNVLDRDAWQAAGFTYKGVGR